MPRPKSLKPSYCLHKPSGRAYVTIGGKCHYLGDYNTQASRDQYDMIVAEWIARGRVSVTSTPEDPSRGVSVSQLIAGFWRHAQRYYGESSRELDNFRYAVKPLKRLYGNVPAMDFGPLKIKALREDAIARGWTRGYINKQISRVKMVFRWGVEQELIPSSVYHGLQAVGGLKRGKTDAAEAEPVKPVPDAHVDAILPFVSRHVRAMIQLQLLTGARPGEVCAMRTGDIDFNGNGAVWLCRPERHKTAHHGHKRTIRIGPKAQDVIRPFLRPNLQEYLFSPAEVEAERRAKLTTQRKTPMSCGNKPGSNRSRSPKRPPNDRYTVQSYRVAITRACERAFEMPVEICEPRSARQKAAADMSPEAIEQRRKARKARRADHTFAPNQFRHNAATKFRRDFGIETAQVLLGHRIGSHVTEIYAEEDGRAAEAIIAKIG
jgi:integrase